MGKRVERVECVVANLPADPEALMRLRARVWSAYYAAVEQHINSLPWSYGKKRALADIIERQLQNGI